MAESHNRKQNIKKKYHTKTIEFGHEIFQKAKASLIPGIFESMSKTPTPIFALDRHYPFPINYFHKVVYMTGLDNNCSLRCCLRGLAHFDNSDCFLGIVTEVILNIQFLNSYVLTS